MSEGNTNGSYDKYLPARVLQVVGLVLLVAAAIFWAITGRESALFMSASMSLILLGAYKSALTTLRKDQNGNGKK